jgi:multidrug efflux pump
MAQYAGKNADAAEIFGRMPVPRAVLTQIGPAIISQMITLIYNLADTYFVGLLNDPNQIAAITICYPAVLMLSAFSNMFGVGGASLIARSLGARDPQKASETSALCFWCTVFVSLLYSALILCFQRPLMALFGASADTMEYAVQYSNWVLIAGGLPAIMNMMLANLVRSVGEAKKASFGVAMGGILNIFLDPLFCLPWGLGLGVEGAAMATALSNLVAAVYFLAYIYRVRGASILSLKFAGFIRGIRHLGSVMAIGLPAALQTALTVVSLTLVNGAVSPYGTKPMAALGIVKKIDFLPLYFSLGVTQGVLPIIGYCYSARQHQRVRQVTVLAGAIACGFSLLCVGCYEILAEKLVGLFIKDAETITYGAAFLRRMCVAMPFMAIGYLFTIKFQAMGKSIPAMFMSLLRKGTLDIPLIALMTRLLPLYGAMYVQPIVDVIAVIVGFALNHYIIKKDRRMEQAA